MTPQRCTPHAFHFFKWKCECVAFGEHEECMTSDELASHVSRQLAEKTFGAISTNGNTKPFPHNDADAAAPRPCPAHEQIETCGGQPTPMLLHIFDIATCTKEMNSISCRSCHDRVEREDCCPGPPARLLCSELGRTAHSHALRKEFLLEEDKVGGGPCGVEICVRPPNAHGLWLGGGPKLSCRSLCSCVCGIRARASF